MKSPHARLRAFLVPMLLAASGMATGSYAQTIAPHPSTPMAQSPAAASGATSASNPDNMPVKKPPKRTDDNMIRSEPASAAKAK